MSKKIWIGSLLALSLTLAAVSVAAAAAPSAADPSSPPSGALGTGPLDPPNPPGPRRSPGRDPLWRPPHLGGEITEIGDDQFTLTTAANNEVTVAVDELTSYLGVLNSFADLEVGLDVAVVGQRSGEGTLLARVVATRDDLPFGTRLGGEVTALGASTLTLETRRGETFTFDVTVDTDFLGRQSDVTGLSDIEIGDHVMVLFEQSTAGGLTANVILVGGPLGSGSN